MIRNLDNTKIQIVPGTITQGTTIPDIISIIEDREYWIGYFALMTDAPIGGDAMIIGYINRKVSNYVGQLCVPYYDEALSFRHFRNGSWGDWRYIQYKS